ncbi:MAG: hypothetical protein ACOCV0_05815, partial [Alkalispirochaeta sp.]
MAKRVVVAATGTLNAAEQWSRNEDDRVAETIQTHREEERRVDHEAGNVVFFGRVDIGTRRGGIGGDVAAVFIVAGQAITTFVT